MQHVLRHTLNLVQHGLELLSEPFKRFSEIAVLLLEALAHIRQVTVAAHRPGNDDLIDSSSLATAGFDRLGKVM
jgi:hypothetical protein